MPAENASGGAHRRRALEPKLISLLFLGLLLAAPAEVATYPITIPYGRSWPLSVVVDSTRGLVYVDATSGEYPPTGFSFGVINVSSHEVMRVLPLNETPGAMAIDLSTGDVFVAGSETFAVFGAGNQSFGRTIAIGRPIVDIAFDSRVSKDLFFTSGSSVFAINPESGVIVANSTVNGGAGMALDARSGRLYVAEYLSGAIAVFQASTLAPTGSIKLPSCCASQLALDSRRQFLYASTGTNYVDVINVGTATFSRSVQIAPSSLNSTNAIAVDNNTGRVYVSSSPGGSIVEIDGPAATVTGDIKASNQVAGLALDLKTGELYATNYHQLTVFSIERSRIFPFLLAGGAALVVVVLLAVFLVFRRRDSAERAKIQSGWQRDQSTFPRRL